MGDAATLGCFVPDTDVRVRGAGQGPLAGLTFAAKDLYDVVGHVTGAGNPDWRDSHAEPADSTATAILQLLDAGADLVGKTITDDLACGMFGENIHYGTPLNPVFPDRVPGGSSSGSVSAVAGGAVDFAIGTDTGGSIRVPASFCGIYGIRPSHGRIPLVGCVPMAPAFDTCGWFARDAELLQQVGDVLLPLEHDGPASRLAYARDAANYVNGDVAAVFGDLLGRLGVDEPVDLFCTG
ncbi:MAG: amidase, partial [Alphaproteobacteria bacterium]|nr:amidase [Alphaproteobacteria bacterium]